MTDLVKRFGFGAVDLKAAERDGGGFVFYHDYAKAVARVEALELELARAESRQPVSGDVVERIAQVISEWAELSQSNNAPESEVSVASRIVAIMRQHTEPNGDVVRAMLRAYWDEFGTDFVGGPKRVERMTAALQVAQQHDAERIAELDERLNTCLRNLELESARAPKPKCPDCNAVGLSHCSDPENCGGVYWPDSHYRKLEAELKAEREARAHWEGRTVSAEARMTAMEQGRARDVEVMPERIASLLDVSEGKP